MVHGTVVQESPQQRGRYPTIQTLGDKSWDSGLGTMVLGQCSLGTVRSWDTGLGTVVLGHWSWDQWSWDSGLGTVVLGQ